MLTLFHQGPGGFTGPRRDEKSRPLTVLQVDASLCDLIQDPGGGAHRHTAFHPEDRAGGQSAVWSTRRATAFHPDGAQTSSFLMTHVCVCISCTHSHEPPWRQHVQEHTYPNMHAAHSCPQAEGKTRTKSGYVHTCAHTHTCTRVSIYAHSHVPPPHLQDSKPFTWIHIRPHSPPKHQRTLCTHTQLHQHPDTCSSYACTYTQLCTAVHPRLPFAHPQAQLYTRAQTDIHIRPHQAGSLWFTHIPIPSTQNIPTRVRVNTHTPQYMLTPKPTDCIQSHSLRCMLKYTEVHTLNPCHLTWAHPGSWLPVGPGRFGSRGWHRHRSATHRWGREPPSAWHLERWPNPRQ